MLGYNSNAGIAVSNLQLDKSVVKMGDDVNFSFDVQSKSGQTQKLVIDYIIHHVKANGKLKSKVFKLAKKSLAARETVQISKRRSFRLISTRKYYAGRHALEIQVNGRKYGKVEFELS